MPIDSHIHLWNFTEEEFSWIPKNSIRKDFIAEDLEKQLATSKIQSAIAVQARCSQEENTFLLDQAEQSKSITGVVGWLDFKSPTLEQDLHDYVSHQKMVGVREIVQGSHDDTYLRNSTFIEGVKKLQKHHMPYDLLIFQNQLESALQFIDDCQGIAMVLNHCGKPEITAKGVPEMWRKHIYAIAQREHVSCKISGLVTEIHDQSPPTPELLYPYYEIILDAFGVERILFGSDWPVSFMEIEHHDWSSMVRGFIKELSTEEQNLIMGENAQKIYRKN